MARTQWKVTTWADAHGLWHAKVETADGQGWGNGPEAPSHSAIRSAARRAIVREIRARQGDQNVSVALTVEANNLDHMNVMRSLTFKEVA